MNYRSSLALAMIASVGMVFSILPAPDNISASQSISVTSSEVGREVRIKVIDDVTSPEPNVEKDISLSEAAIEQESFPIATHKTNTSEPEEERPVEIINTEQTKQKSVQTETGVFTVPFYSQFADITPVEWKKIGCGIASLAMLIDFYKPGSASVDGLLQEGIASGAYINSAGWSHAGLINLSKQFGMSGESHSMSGSSMESAFATLTSVLKDGPVMVSVHYTFDPRNPIPHLVVVNGVKDGKVFYNDPAEEAGGGSVSIAQFQSAWKKRYIEIRPS